MSNVTYVKVPKQFIEDLASAVERADAAQDPQIKQERISYLLGIASVARIILKGADRVNETV